MANLLHRALAAVMASGGKFAAQLAISVAATVCAAVVVPQLLPRFGLTMTPVRIALAPLAPSATDLDAAFVQPIAPSLANEGKIPLEPPQASVRPVNAVADAPAAMAAAPVPAARACGQRCEVRRTTAQAAPASAPVAATVPTSLPPSRPAAPLELASMMTPLPAAAVEAPRRQLFGLPLPQLPFEDKVVQSVTSARNVVAHLFD
ncbi:hypothetical protein [Phreatobacter stygius]|uniref:Energy transducer TonB n=1 Tax=Phreatobacter stygius TaxID=1940610 RepID=A0A4D7B271_9HYPH|nr:hypothetical protein [Phreatobacter stygius]QCI66911.1 hypothetical protein E8M01_23290 [Phreatobacter stygius]